MPQSLSRILLHLIFSTKVSSNLAVRYRYLSQLSWQNGYAAFSVSESILEAVAQYESDQETHHKTITLGSDIQIWWN